MVYAKGVIRLVAVGVALTLLASCRLQISTPQSGQVISESGAYLCAPNTSCLLEINDLHFSETFTAVPEEGYEFSYWKDHWGHLCRGMTGPCSLSTAQFEQSEKLMDVLASDKYTYLEPIFFKPGGWARMDWLPVPRLAPAFASAAGKLFALGGILEDGKLSYSHHRYDPKTNDWLQMLIVISPMTWRTATSVDDTVYIFGGIGAPGNYQGTLQAYVTSYDAITERWHVGAEIPFGRYAASAASIDGKVYIAGGMTPDGPTDVLERYDPASGRWTTLSPMPTARAYLSAVAVDGKLYVFGGGPDVEDGTTRLEIYDPAMNEWTLGAAMPTSRTALCAAELDGLIYVTGGAMGGPEERRVLKTVDVYDPVLGEWTTAPPFSVERWGHGCAALDGRLWIFGGSRGDDEIPAVRRLEAFTPE